MPPDGLSIDGHADHPVAPTPLPVNDPDVFHRLVEIDAPNEWRLRRTDIWREGHEYFADAWSQDSSSLPGDANKRLIFHEYGILARFAVDSLELRAITAKTPYFLPYITCHAAPATAQALVGRTAIQLRRQVLARLRGSNGCTHLNDMLRALQDVAFLALLLADNGAARCVGAGRTFHCRLVALHVRPTALRYGRRLTGNIRIGHEMSVTSACR